MILQFKTKRNANGHRKYLAIDTDARIYSTQCRWMIMEGVEVTTTAYRELLEQCKRNEFKEVDYAC